MTTRSKTWKVLAVGAALATMQMTAVAQDKSKDRGWLPDSVSAEYGFGSHVEMVRAAVQWDWNKQWFSTGGWSLGGYWDLNVMQWRGDRYKNIRGKDQDITSVGITPVFRWQRNDKKGFYVEGGIGANLLSETYNNAGHRNGTLFQFGDHAGLGYVFGNGVDLGVKYQHFSNGGMSNDNDGVDFTELRVLYRF